MEIVTGVSGSGRNRVDEEQGSEWERIIVYVLAVTIFDLMVSH